MGSKENAVAVGEEVPSKGVRKKGKKWVAEIMNCRLRGEAHVHGYRGRKWLGTFATASEAREAYARAMKKIKQFNGVFSSAQVLQADAAPVGSHSSSSSLSTHANGLTGVPGSAPEESTTGLDSGPYSIPLGKKLSPSPVADLMQGADVHQEAISDWATFEQEGVKGRDAMNSWTLSLLPRSSPGKFRSGKTVDLNGAQCTCYADPYDSSYTRQASTVVLDNAYTSSSYVTKLINEVQNHQSFQDPSLETRGEKRKGHSADGLHGSAFSRRESLNEDSAPADIRPSNDVLATYTLFAYNADIFSDDYVDFSTIVPGERYCASVKQASASRVCRCSSLCTDTLLCRLLCDHGHACHLIHYDEGGNMDGTSHVRMDNECQDLPRFCALQIKVKGFSAFKTKHIISELRAELPELQIRVVPHTVEVLEISRSVVTGRSKGKKYQSMSKGLSPLSSSPVATVVSGGIPTNQEILIESRHGAQLAVNTEFGEPGGDCSSVGDTSLSCYEGPNCNGSLRGGDGIDLLPLEELMKYFDAHV